MAFDGIVCKSIVSELNKLSGARMDKVFQPNKNDVILGFYLDGKNYALNCCIDSQYYRVNLTTHSKPNPKVAPNFCMLLRKNLLGLRIKSAYTIDLERVIFIEFEGFNEVDDIISYKLIIELMGKHSNIILVDSSNIIIDSLRHIKDSENAYRNILPHYKYAFPKTDKINFFDIANFEEFKSHISSTNIDNLVVDITSTFNGFSNSFVKDVIQSLNIKTISDTSLQLIYNHFTNIINNIGNLRFKELPSKKDYVVELSDNTDFLNLNFAIDDFYYVKETNITFKMHRDNILKLILATLKKYNKRLYNIDEKLKQCENMDIYKLYGELITANLYRIKDENVDFIKLENYYDNNNLISIPLDKRYSPSVNAKRYFKKYNKLKNALIVVTKQKEETLQELNYIESVVYELENSSTLEEVSDIFEEISEHSIFKESMPKHKKNIKAKKSQLTKNKTVNFNPIKYTIDGYTILVGRNNKENDYLTLKYASKSDYWFHTKDIHGSHVVLKLNSNITNVTDDILIKCAQIAALHSKAKNSSNVPVDFCQVKFVKKPSGSKPGMVIYTNNRTLNVQPKI